MRAGCQVNVDALSNANAVGVQHRAFVGQAQRARAAFDQPHAAAVFQFAHAP